MVGLDSFCVGCAAGDGALFRMIAGDGTAAAVTSYGARLVSLHVPQGDGDVVDVTLGYDTLAAYRSDGSTYFGATIGRYANRIAGGALAIGGRSYQLSRNEGFHTLHGGGEGFDRRVWSTRFHQSGRVGFSLLSPDGDQGFPGNLLVEVDYILTCRALRIEYMARTDAATFVNLTNHSYFNLAGEGAGVVDDHALTLAAAHYLPIDGELIPTGEFAAVSDTPFDFRKETPIGQAIGNPHPQISRAGGFDHCFVLDGGVTPTPRRVARLRSRRNGLAMTVHTTEPGLQLYTANRLAPAATGKSGAYCMQHSALCLETQHFPDSPGHPSFPSTLLQPGEVRRSATIFSFA